MDIQKVKTLTKHPDLRVGQKVRILIDFYDEADVEEDRRPVHRKGNVGSIDGLGIVFGQEVVAVEICHHGAGTYKVIPVLPTDLERVPDETPLTEPDPEKKNGEDPLIDWDDDKPVILLDIKKTD